MDEAAVVFEHLWIDLEVVPVETVDAVGRVEGIVYPFLVAQHLFATKHERNTLRSEHKRLRQEVELYQFGSGYARYRVAYAVG